MKIGVRDNNVICVADCIDNRKLNNKLIGVFDNDFFIRKELIPVFDIGKAYIQAVGIWCDCFGAANINECVVLSCNVNEQGMAFWYLIVFHRIFDEHLNG